MSIEVPRSVMAHATEPGLADRLHKSERWGRRGDDDITVEREDLSDAALADLVTAAAAAGHKSFGRVAAALLAARNGDFSKKIPRLTAAPEMLLDYLRATALDGWVYRTTAPGRSVPYLVTDVHLAEGRGERPPAVQISLVTNNDTKELGVHRDRVTLFSEDVTRRSPVQVLEAAGLTPGTGEMQVEHAQVVERYRAVLTEGFARQYRLTGKPLAADGRWASDINTRTNAKVIHDVSPEEIKVPAEYAETALFPNADADDELGGQARGRASVPVRPSLRVFDLSTHESVWVDVRDLTEHVWDDSLRDKIVLPPDQQELLNILTADLTTFTDDIIEGKSAGNVILCKGKPGVGKTLTAEVYAELIHKPLYAIHSGNLGIAADQIRENLETIFKRAKRWGAVLLLDEADVFVMVRGSSINQNAIVAEFLRTLEYFDGLMFMTTNRSDDIDEAIVSRCAAIIDYKVPDTDGQRAVWTVQAANAGVALPEPLLAALVAGFADIAPRDVKMLLRLALRVAAHRGVELSVETFRDCAMFRGLHYAGPD